MDFTLILSAVRKGLDYAEGLLPMAQAIGGDTVAVAIKAVAAAAEVAENLNKRIEEGKVVATSNDQERLKAIIAGLAKVNDELAAYIDTH